MLDLSNQTFYEDIPIGYKEVGLSRTIDFADIINYANFTRDYNPIHIDKESSKKSLIGDVMAHGLIATIYSSGMLLRTGFGTRTLKTLLACKGYKEIKFLRPVLIGDTITVHFEVIDKKDFDDTKGLIEICFNVLNQKGEKVQTHYRTYLFAKRNYDFETIAERGCW